MKPAIATSPYKRPESVLVVVYTLDGWVLMLRRVSPKGYWQSVTGSLEWGERALDAAVRELREETRLIRSRGDLAPGRNSRFRIIEPWCARYAPDARFNREYGFYLGLPAPLPITPNPAEHTEVRWVRPHQALRMARSRTDRAAIRRLP